MRPFSVKKEGLEQIVTIQANIIPTEDLIVGDLVTFTYCGRKTEGLIGYTHGSMTKCVWFKCIDADGERVGWNSLKDYEFTGTGRIFLNPEKADNCKKTAEARFLGNPYKNKPVTTDHFLSLGSYKGIEDGYVYEYKGSSNRGARSVRGKFIAFIDEDGDLLCIDNENCWWHTIHYEGMSINRIDKTDILQGEPDVDTIIYDEIVFDYLSDGI